MTVFILMVAIFLIGYTAIALEHPIKINKSATALFIGMILWTIYALFNESVLNLNFSPAFEEAKTMAANVTDWIKPNVEEHQYKTNWEETAVLSENSAESGHFMEFIKKDLGHHLDDIAQILFFLLGAMTIVETVDRYQGFKIITDKIKTTNPVKLAWIIGFITFFMSSVLDNLTTTIVLIALLRKIIDEKQLRWFFASLVVIAANSGGAFSPIGDVTTIMLWIGGNVTAGKIIAGVFLPSLVSMVVPLIFISFMLKGKTFTRPEQINSSDENFTSDRERIFMLALGVGALLFVPIFKTVTHLPPYIGMLFGLGAIWIATELILARKNKPERGNLSLLKILQSVDVPTIFFFLGILLAVAALQSAGHLSLMADWLDKVTNQNTYVIATAIGILSAIVDNVPLVASAMGMYPIAEAGHFMQDGLFWELIAYTAGTGGSILIIGSAAGVAAMGLEKIDFIWYMKKISWLALVGYFAGILVYWAQQTLFHTLG